MLGDLLHAEGLVEDGALRVMQRELLMERGANLERRRWRGTDTGQHGFGTEGPGEAGVRVTTVTLQIRWGQEGAQARIR